MQIKRICPGYYEASMNGNTVSINQREDGSGWHVVDDNNIWNHSDVLPTYKVSKMIALEMLERI